VNWALLTVTFAGGKAIVEVKIDDQRQMVGSIAGQLGMGDPDLTDGQRPSCEGLVDGRDRKIGRERPEPRARRRELVKPVPSEGPLGEGISPVVEVADDQRWEVGRFAEQRVIEQMQNLPVSLALGQAKVPMDQVEGTLRAGDDSHLSPSGLPVLQPQRDLVVVPKGPSREDEIAIPSPFEFDVELKKKGHRMQGLDQPARLIVMASPRDIAINFLKTDQVGVLIFDDFDDPFQSIAAVTSADAFMDIITKNSHIPLA
jgi:hypothetical protein